MTLGATLVTSLLATLAHPTTWLLALGGFLVRGGIVLFLIPIVVLPSPVGLANATGPTVVGFVLGGFSFDLVVLLVLVVGAVLAWIVFGGLLAATLEVDGIRIVATDDDVVASGRAMDEAARAAWDAQVAAAPAHAFDPSRQALRIVAVRMAMLFPLMAAMIWASARTVAVTYAELTVPSDVTTPIVWRIVTAVPDAIVVVVFVWVVGEIVGGIGARRIVLDGAPIAGALGGATIQVVRHPLRALVLFGIPSIALLLVVIPAGVAATVAWTGLRAALVDRDVVVGAVALLVFIALWAGGLALTGAVAAWRHAAWTVDAVTDGHRTFGGSAAGHPGDWNTEGRSGTV